MNKVWWTVISLVLACGLGICGCNGDDDDDDGDNGDTSTGGPDANDCIPERGTIIKDWPDSLSTHDGDTGAQCRIMEDCKSNYCESFQDSPPDPDATCQDGPAFGSIRVTGNLRDFETREAIPGVSVDIIGGPGMASNPTGPALATITTDENGRFEYDGGSELTRITIALGARVDLSDQGYILSATGLIRPEINNTDYPPGVRGHDIYAVPQSLVDSWNAMLQKDPCVSPSGGPDSFFLPLGAKGGAFGRLQDADTGNPPAKPLVLRSQIEDTTSLVRYLNEEGTAFVDTQSSSNGFFVILSNQDMELFDAYRDGKRLNKFSCRVGKATGGAGVVYINVDIDEW